MLPSQAYNGLGGMVQPRGSNEMTAKQIMNESAMWATWSRTVWDCFWATRDSTDYADWLESRVIYEDTLRAQDIMAEVTK